MTQGESVEIEAGTSIEGELSVTGQIKGVGMCPTGTIIMYHGDLADRTLFDADGAGVAGSEMAGWQVCNDNNGAPDLRERFIVGVGSGYALGATGGANDVTLKTPQLPTHDHGGGGQVGFTLDLVAGDPALPQVGLAFGQSSNLGSYSWKDTVHVLPNGNGEAHENRPPYFALVYLIRTGG